MSGPTRRPRPSADHLVAAGQSQAAVDQPSQAVDGEPVGDRQLPPAMLAVGYLIFALAGVLTAIYEVLLVPTRWGSTLIPLAPLLAIIGNVGLPIVARQLTHTAVSAVPPVIGWFVTIFVLASARPEGDVLLPAGKTAWVSYGLLICGALAAIGTLALGEQPGRWAGRWLGSAGRTRFSGRIRARH